MNFIKTYEENNYRRPFRKLDVQELYSDFLNCALENERDFDFVTNLTNYELTTNFNGVSVIDDYFIKKVLSPIVLNKEVEIPMDKIYIESYEFIGRIKLIRKDLAASSYGALWICCSVFDADRDSAGYHLAKRLSLQEGKPQIIKIYNSEETEMEKKINFLKNTKKFGL